MNKGHIRYILLLLALVGAWGGLGIVREVAAAAPPPPPDYVDVDDYPPLAENDPLLPPPLLEMQAALNTLPDPADPITLPQPAWRIGVITDGLYALDYATLDAAGVPVTTTDPDAYRLFWRGQEVALDDSEIVTTFDASEAFYFYGEKFHGSEQDEKYTDENVYWLTVDDTTPGLRMSSRSVAGSSSTPLTWYTDTAQAEENLVYWGRHSTTPGTDTTWFWEKIRALTVSTYTYPIELSSVVTGGYSATLSLEVAGYSESHDQLLTLALNGNPIGEVTWYGRREYTATLEFPSTFLRDGENLLDVGIHKLASVKPIAYFDRYQIDYRRAPAGQDDSLLFASPSVGSDVAITLTNFSSADLYLLDVTQPLQPVRLTGSTPTADGLAFVDDLTTEGKGYLAASQALSPVSVEAYHATVDLLQPAEGADVIAIAPEAFFTALQPWVDRREAQGYRVRVVDVEDTYALFNGGVLHPEAIRSFVAYAHANWPAPAPEYLVLVGDGHFNFKGFNPATYGDFLPVHIPPYLDFLDPDQGEVPVDSYYADLDGDGLADFAVGRFPVQTVSQLEGVVGKILAYEDQEPGPWMRNLLFVADDGYNNSEPGFAAALDNLAATYASPLLSMDKVYIKDYCSPVSVNPCIAATLALTQSWGQGPALLTYSGHGSINRWGHEPLLWNVDVATLEPMEGLPFIISLDCWDGYWMFPSKYPVVGVQDVRSLGEWATTLLTDRGAIGLFGPAGLGYLYIEETMVEAMYEAIFEDYVLNLGALTQVGREAIAASYLGRTYTLLGDPTLELRLTPPRDPLYLPLVLRP